jgi:hypothetical protein
VLARHAEVEGARHGHGAAGSARNDTSASEAARRSFRRCRIASGSSVGWSAKDCDATRVPRFSKKTRREAPCPGNSNPDLAAIALRMALEEARLVFDLPLKGNIVELLLAVPLYASSYLILGFAFSAVAENQLQAIQGAVFFYLPSILLSGFMFPLTGCLSGARDWRSPAAHSLREGHALRFLQRSMRIGCAVRDDACGSLRADSLSLCLVGLSPRID